jgi:ubiquinone/menaquinone biosynthesis C-methylase UbiE
MMGRGSFMTTSDQGRTKKLLDPERYHWQNPDAIVDAIGLVAGMTFADIGSGPGFFTLAAAKKVGPGGKVFALDVSTQMLDFLKESAAKAGLSNIAYVVTSNYTVPLDDSVADVTLIANVLHEVSEPQKLLRESARITRPDGRLVVIEWKKEDAPKGPPARERLASEEIAEALQAIGFEYLESFEAGPYSYGWKARRK